MTLPLLASGKVREIYDLGGDLLMVASDRISTYDVVHVDDVVVEMRSEATMSRSSPRS